MCAYMYTVLYGGFLFSRYTFVLQSLIQKCCDQSRVIWLGEKISIINNPGFHRGKLRSWVLDVGGEEPRATSAVTATRPAVGVHYSEYIGLSFTLHTTSQLFIRHVLLWEKKQHPKRGRYITWLGSPVPTTRPGPLSLFTQVSTSPRLAYHTPYNSFNIILFETFQIYFYICCFFVVFSFFLISRPSCRGRKSPLTWSQGPLNQPQPLYPAKAGM